MVCDFRDEMLHQTFDPRLSGDGVISRKLIWLVLGWDLAARSHRVEQLTALGGL